MTLTSKLPEHWMKSDAYQSLANFPVTYNVTADEVEIFLYGIVGDECNQTDSLSVAQLLSSNRGKAVSLRVNSPGGLAYDGVAMFNAIQAHDGPTTGIIEGLAGSAASLAVCACDTVKSYSSGVFHPHYSLVFVMGHRAEIEDALLAMKVLDEELVATYMRVSGQTESKVRDDLQGPNGDGTRFTAKEALKAGYIHEIIEPKRKKASKAEIKAVGDDKLRILAARVKMM